MEGITLGKEGGGVVEDGSTGGAGDGVEVSSGFVEKNDDNELEMSGFTNEGSEVDEEDEDVSA